MLAASCPKERGSGSRPVRVRRDKLLRLGLGQPDRPRRTPLAAHPAPPPLWRPGLLPLLRTTLARLGELVRVPGRRWTLEESFQAAEGLAGLDQHQVRCWLPWRRWTLLAMLAHAFLAIVAATDPSTGPRPGLITLTCNEIRRLSTTLITEPPRTLADPLAWSHWRRQHQYRARTSHYRKQAVTFTCARSTARVLGRPDSVDP
ncbi:MAG: hypothetical protein LC799_31550 [Actinobacteria bacterium]|nr:hypothetical protein [Actinomycetota bacterium]